MKILFYTNQNNRSNGSWIALEPQQAERDYCPFLRQSQLNAAMMTSKHESEINLVNAFKGLDQIPRSWAFCPNREDHHLAPWLDQLLTSV